MNTTLSKNIASPKVRKYTSRYFAFGIYEQKGMPSYVPFP
jgi:hypothetical protein